MTPWLRRIPIDVIAWIAIALVIFATHQGYALHGMQFNDPAWYFHFGNRVVHGEVPYRDFIFQVGPLPIYVDAGFQEVFGERYVASMYAGIAIKVVRVALLWMIARRLAGWPSALALSVFCAFDITLGWLHHWSTPYSQVFLLAAGLAMVVASQVPPNRAARYLGLAGVCIGLEISARQSTAVMMVVVVLGASVTLLVRRDTFTLRRFAALWAGVALGMALTLVFLAAIGALGPALQQMFVDAPQKKDVDSVRSVLDAISGGAFVMWRRSWWSGGFEMLLWPSVVVALMLFASSRRGATSTHTVALLAMPIAVLLGLTQRVALLPAVHDLPRVFLTAMLAFAVLAPGRLRAWLGLEPLAVLGLGALALASDWANEMSYPGRGWGDIASTVVGCVLVLLSSTRLSQRAKLGACTALALCACVHLAVHRVEGTTPFTKDNAIEGRVADNHASFRHPILRGMRVSEARRRALGWLARTVPPGSSCFMYGNVPLLYDLLGCHNPTRVDTTIADFLTLRDAETMLAALRADPPDYLLAQEQSFTNPDLEVELEGKVEVYSALNSSTSRALHLGLRELLLQYESVGRVADAIGPELDRTIALSWDTLTALRVYKRKAAQ